MHPTRTTDDRPAHPEWAARAVSEHAAAWTAEHAVDPGDSHDKGESLCVGEAA